MSQIVDLVREPLIVHTPRLMLRPLESRDAAQLLALFADPAVTEFMDIAPMTDLAEAAGVVDWANDRRAHNAGVRWGVRMAGEERLLGTCGFNLLELDRGRRGEVAYDLAPAHWGQGLASEALSAVIGFGAQRLGLHRLEAMVTPGNTRSVRLLERHGFVREGVLRDHGFWKGRFWDQMIYARLAPFD
ncbi:MAG: GNAT family protein [Phenylobacterium sp.]|uniref:GNAT family N-acetyltransferase n=1 Tax=Phenylobacterium sp. TaxID=1871053 RepID=UPI0027373066|nr:GNAT family protein [Phenylobacterium sp.]MDP3175823.1 GNAT family protein [Phenylobacterium sp.]